MYTYFILKIHWLSVSFYPIVYMSISFIDVQDNVPGSMKQSDFVFSKSFFLIRNANRLRLSLPLSIFIAISQEKNVHIGSANDVPPFQCKRAPQQDKMILSCKRQRCRPIDFHLRIGVSC